MRLLEFLNDSHMVFGGISFGDQVQFFRRRLVVQGNVYPDMPLMEDAELSLRLSRLGRQTYLFGSALISARKWKGAHWTRFAKLAHLFCSYLWMRLWGRVDTAAMFRLYYETTSKHDGSSFSVHS